MFASLEENSQISKMVPIYILHEQGKIKPETRVDLEEFIRNKGYNNTHFVSVDIDNFCNLLLINNNDHVTKSTYVRLFLNNFLPLNITSVLYLDVDLLILNEINSLYNCQIDQPIAAVNHYSIKDEIRLWGPNGGRYFQAGVLLLDMQYYRNNEIDKVALEVLKSRKDIIKWHDQDVLNIIFENRWFPLEYRYNATSKVLNNINYNHFDSISIVHFEGENKPWKLSSNRHFTNAWLKYYYQLYEKKWYHIMLRLLFRVYNRIIDTIYSKLKYRS